MSRAIADATLVIPTRNRPQLVLDAVRAVLAGGTLPAEILVVDQSDPPAAERVAAGLASLEHDGGSAVRRLVPPRRGASHARNAGVAAARRRWILFLDDDILVTPDWCARLVATLEGEPDGTLVSGRVLGGTPELEGGFTTAIEDGDEGFVLEAPTARDLLATCNAGAARTTLETLGGFDERLGPGTAFPAAEDNDLGRRALATGHRIVYAPDVVVAHRRWRPASRRLTLRRRYGIGQGGFYAKHLLAGDRAIVRRIAGDLRRLTLRAGRRIARGDPAAALGDAAYLLGLAQGLAAWTVGRPTAIPHAATQDRPAPHRDDGPAA